eukprot:10324041-Lingulodinium_polyedra.AAC.1
MASGSCKAQRLSKCEEEESTDDDAVTITKEDWQTMNEEEQSDFLTQMEAPSQKTYRNFHMAMAKDAGELKEHNPVFKE